MKYSDIKRASDGTFTIGEITGVPDIDGGGIGEPAAWFLGPRAENRQLFDRLIQQALEHVYAYRQDYLPGDPEAITPQMKDSAAYRQAEGRIFSAYRDLLSFLGDHSIPFFSLRYQGHMLWDNTLPALAGYFSAMLHNPNNVSVQASAATTPLEMLVGWDLCRMIGYRFSEQLEPWAHLTADGSLANIEATWATRELKFLPFAVRALLNSSDQAAAVLQRARPIELTLCDGSSKPVREADNWQLFNTPADETLALPAQIADLCGLEVLEVWNLLLRHTPNALGWSAMAACMDGLGAPPMLIWSSTKHYSWPKAAAVAGFGSRAMGDILVDTDARLDPARLDRALSECLEKRIPVAMVVAVCGSTEESAVDPIDEILALRERYRRRGLDFNLHVDAAWGGYMITRIRRDYRLMEEGTSLESPFLDDFSGVPASDYSLRQLMCIRHGDSATIDPHKWGYVQYPAGAVLYRNGEIKHLTTFTGAYIGASEALQPEEPSVGVYGLEGSRPGAAAAAVYLSHRCIRPSVSGHGQLIDECLFNTRRFYARLLSLNHADRRFFVVPLPRLPAERNGDDVQAQLDLIQASILGRSNDELLRDSETMALFRQLGPDQNILDYAFNLRGPDGTVNSDAETCDRLNRHIFDAFHAGCQRDRPIRDCRFFLSSTIFKREEYGDDFMDSFAERLGLAGRPTSLYCLRSVIMDPYITHTTDGSYFVEIIEIIRETVEAIIERHFTSWSKT